MSASTDRHDHSTRQVKLILSQKKGRFELLLSCGHIKFYKWRGQMMLICWDCARGKKPVEPQVAPQPIQTPEGGTIHEGEAPRPPKRIPVRFDLQ